MANDIISQNGDESFFVIKKFTQEEHTALKTAIHYGCVMSDYVTTKRNKIQSNLNNHAYADRDLEAKFQDEVKFLSSMISNFDDNAKKVMEII